MCGRPAAWRVLVDRARLGRPGSTLPLRASVARPGRGHIVAAARLQLVIVVSLLLLILLLLLALTSRTQRSAFVDTRFVPNCHCQLHADAVMLWFAASRPGRATMLGR